MALKRSRKIALIVVAVLAVVIAVSVVIQRRKAGVIAVQAGKVARESLTQLVTASGEIRRGTTSTSTRSRSGRSWKSR